MSFHLADFDLTQYLWDVIAKTDPDVAVFTEHDMFDLWEVGFVDTERVPLKQWAQIVKPFLQTDGTYHFRHEEFLTLDQYRYKGELYAPFEAEKINEGFYTDEGLDELFHTSIQPCVRIKPQEFLHFIKEYKDKFRDTQSKLIHMNEKAKRYIDHLLSLYPSPLRNLELLFEEMIQTQVYGVSDNAVGHELAKQVSTFRDRPANKVEAEALGLKDLLQTKTKNTSVPAVEKDKTVSLKNVRRSPRGTRG